MVIKHRYQFIFFAIMLFSFITTAYATGEGFYVGIMLGQTDINNNPKNVVGNSSPSPNPPVNNCVPPTSPNGFQCVQTNVSPTNTGFGGRFYIGGNFSKWIGLEFGYTHFAASEYDAKLLNPPRSPQIQENGVDLSLKGMIPFENFGVFAKAGIAYVRRTAGGSLTQPSPTGQRTGTTNNVRPIIAIGAFYDITPNWEVDLSATRVMGGSNDFQDADLYALGFSYHFVSLYCGQFLC